MIRRKLFTKKILVCALVAANVVCTLPAQAEAAESTETVYVYALDNDKASKEEKKQEKEEAKAAKQQEKEEKKQEKEEAKQEKKRLNKEKHAKKEKKASVEERKDEWNLRVVNAASVSVEAPQERVKVAIIDSGVDYTEDIDVYVRKNFIPGENEVSIIYEDICGHGTSVAGIIAAKDNAIGITGINPNVELYSARVLDAEEKAPVSRVAEAIYWAIEKEVDIINLSFGTTTDSTELYEAIQAADEAGILIVAAAGNNGTVEYPAAYDEVIAVGAVDAQGNRSECSAVGEDLELVAPGEQIASTGAFGGVCVVGGTSMAAPHVTAVASVLWQKDLSVSADFIRDLLAFSANQYGDSSEYGYGLVDLEFALNQYDAFKASYNEENPAEAVEAAVAAGELQENETEVLAFEDVAYVEGSWGKSTHEALAGVKSIESGKELSASGMAIVKKGAVGSDTFLYHMSYYPEFHGYTSRQVNGEFDHFSNYIFAYIYITEIAAAAYEGINPGDSTAIPHEITAKCIGTCSNHGGGGRCGNCVETMKSYIDGAFTMDGLAKSETLDHKAEWLTKDRTWSGLIGKANPTDREISLYIYGMALHTITDLFAHSAFDTNKAAIKHPDADNTQKTASRYECAELISQYVISHIKRFRSGRLTDIYEVISSDAYDGEFKLGRLNQYIKAIDSDFYQNNKTVIDDATN